MDSSVNGENHEADTESPHKQLSGSLDERLQTLTPSSSSVVHGSMVHHAPKCFTLTGDSSSQKPS